MIFIEIKLSIDTASGKFAKIEADVSKAELLSLLI